MSKNANKENVKVESNRKVIKVDTINVPNMISSADMRKKFKENK